MGYDQNIDSSGIQKFILKYTDEVVQTEDIETHLLMRRINRLRDDKTKISFQDFYKLFLNKSSSMLISTATPGLPSTWNSNEKKTFSFKSEPQTFKKPTKEFKKPQLNKMEELHCFKRYFLAKLNLDQKLENYKIELISSDFFNLHECFDLLSNNSSEISSKSLNSVVSDLSE